MHNAAWSRHFNMYENIYRQTKSYLGEERRYAIDRAKAPELKQNFPDLKDLDALAKRGEAKVGSACALQEEVWYSVRFQWPKP